MTSEIKVDTISEQTSANGVTIDGLTIKDGNIIGDVALAGTTPTFTIGDGGAEDAALIFDGNAVDYYMALDDSADNLIIGSGSTVGSNSLITIDSNGDLDFDVSGNIKLDADDAGEIRFLDGGTQYAAIKKDGNNALFQSIVADGDFIIQGIDSSSFISALTLDMSDAGTATFNHDVKLGDDGELVFGDGGDLKIRHDSSNNVSFIEETGSSNFHIRGNQIVFKSQTDNDDFAKFIENGAVELYHSNSKKFETSANGADITGILTTTGNAGIGTSSIDVSTQAGGSGFRVLQIENDEGGQINLDHNDAGTGSTLGQINFQRAGEVVAEIEGVTDGATDNGKINFRTQPDGGDLTVRWTIDHDGIIYPGSTSQGIALGVTAATASNILDDYEEGTWTATFTTTGTAFTTSSNTSTQFYTKVGRLVTLAISASVASPSNGTGNIKITGLPFTSGSHDTVYSNATRPGRIDNADGGIVATMFSSSSTLTFEKGSNNGAPVSVAASELNGNTTPFIGLSFSYYV